MSKYNTKIKYIKINNSDRLYEVEKISFYDFSIKAVETDLKIGDVHEEEIWNVSDLGDYAIKLQHNRYNNSNIIDLGKWKENNNLE